MVQIDIPWAFLIGSTLADSANVELKQEGSALRSSCFLSGLAFLAILFNPSGMYLLWKYPDWETMYWLGGRGVVPIIPTIFLAVLSAVYTLGFVFGHRKLRQDQRPSLQRINTMASFAILLFLAINYHRFFFVGTYQQFASGARLNMTGSTLYRDLAIMGLLLTPGYLCIYRYFQIRGEKILSGLPPDLNRQEKIKILYKVIPFAWGVLGAGALFVALAQRLLLKL